MRLSLTLVALALFGASAGASEFWSRLKDPEDGWVDASHFLLNGNLTFLPLPIVITEPAVDGGLGLAGVFFHRRPESETRDTDAFVRPSLSAIAAASTGNDSWMVGGGHLGIWRKDTIRYIGGAGFASVNLKYYGGSRAPLGKGLAFNAKGAFLVQEALFRIADSRWMAGGRWQFSKTEIGFDTGFDIPGIDSLELDFQDAGAGLVVEYEALDSTFTPSAGNRFRFEALWHHEAMGGDFNYGDYRARYLHFLSLGNVVLGGRLDVDHIDGLAPFFLEPFVRIRGIPALRYQGSTVVTGEAEARWDFHPRISAVAFLGAGRAADGFSELSDASNRVAGGIGIRYLLARLMGLRLGVDVARGPEDWAFYLTVGHAWAI